MWRLNKDALSLNEYATWPNTLEVEGGFNTMVKYLAADEVDLPLLRVLVVRSSTPEGEAMLELAKRRLDAMDFVGTTSRFQDSVRLLRRATGIKVKTKHRALRAVASTIGTPSC